MTVQLGGCVVVVVETARVVVVVAPMNVVVVVDPTRVVVVVLVVVVPLAAHVAGLSGAPSSKSRQPSRSRSIPTRTPEPNGTQV